MKLAFSAALAAGVLLTPIAVFAADENFCDDYASQALIAATQNKAKPCGFTGPRWAPDYDVHFNWCVQVPQGAAAAERQARKSEIQSCLHIDRDREESHGKLKFCREYANLAIISASQNEALQCGLRGSRWGTSYRQHVAWCMQVPKETAMAERFGRRQDIQDCQGAN